mmetsp:Transcript_74608/g.222538  ORF Transcript_74608/g.222538 Transcript_74608/m.222538 type:complete len:216 (-) Transcript_74608:2697-3344(-)
MGEHACPGQGSSRRMWQSRGCAKRGAGGGGEGQDGAADVRRHGGVRGGGRVPGTAAEAGLPVGERPSEVVSSRARGAGKGVGTGEGGREVAGRRGGEREEGSEGDFRLPRRHIQGRVLREVRRPRRRVPEIQRLQARPGGPRPRGPRVRGRGREVPGRHPAALLPADGPGPRGRGLLPGRLGPGAARPALPRRGRGFAAAPATGSAQGLRRCGGL